jgi:hypothetical protein
MKRLYRFVLPMTFTETNRMYSCYRSIGAHTGTRHTWEKKQFLLYERLQIYYFGIIEP